MLIVEDFRREPVAPAPMIGGGCSIARGYTDDRIGHLRNRISKPQIRAPKTENRPRQGLTFSHIRSTIRTNEQIMKRVFLMQATSTFTITKWDERTYIHQSGGAKITRVTARKIFVGDLDGISQLELLMFYWPDGAGTFMGFEHVVGSLNGQAGSFTLQHTGTYVDGTIISTVVIVAGSGTEQLREVCGMGQSTLAEHQHESPFTLYYNFVEQDELQSIRIA